MRSGAVPRDHILGLGGASVPPARVVVREPAGHAPDLVTGCGIQALHLDAHSTEIVAIVSNPSDVK